MPANGNIAVNDGASTPVSHTFVPAGISSTGTAHFIERTDGIFVGEPRLDVAIRPVTKGQATRKASVTLSVPKRVVDSVTGEVKVQYDNLAKAEFVVSATSTTTERKNGRVMLANALLNALVASAIDNNEGFW